MRGLSVRPNKSSSYWGGLTDPATENGGTGNDNRTVPPLREPKTERDKSNPRRVSLGRTEGSFAVCGRRPGSALLRPPWTLSALYCARRRAGALAGVPGPCHHYALYERRSRQALLLQQFANLASKLVQIACGRLRGDGPEKLYK